jgi:galactokinase
MKHSDRDKTAAGRILELARDTGIEVTGGKIRRTSSRFCLGVEHGDYNGTELFGVGTDKFIWLGYRPNTSGRVRLFSGNFPGDGVVGFELGNVPGPRFPGLADSWARFPCGVDHILRREGIELERGIDGVVYGDIPGGGMSRSASLTLNLILSLLDVNGVEIGDRFKIVDMAQAVENDYIGSPCGRLDQIMILFSRGGFGTHYNPRTGAVDYVPLGAGEDFRIVVLDTGTERPGLEKSTYRVRRAECEKFVSMLRGAGYRLECLADVRKESLFREIVGRFSGKHGELCDRLRYIFAAQERFYRMLDAWKAGDIDTVGAVFREDGIGLRDDYRISGPQLETMCDIARTVPGVMGERMLGGGDKGASGALVRPEVVDTLKNAVDLAYPRSFPHLADRYAVHTCGVVDGVSVFEGLL